MGLFNDDMTGLAAAYASMNDGKYLLTNADKVGNTPAWQNRYKVNESTGEMLYEMADHLKEAYEEELIAKIDATLEELRRLDEGKIPAGLQAYLDKKKGKKDHGDKKEEENGKDHGGSKGSKPDFLDLDKDGDKKEPMKKAAKEKKEETEYNYVNAYLDELKKTTMGSYIAKASKDLADRRFDQGDSEKRKYDPDEADEKEDKKLDKREQGIARAAKKITKEDYVDEKVMGADPTMRMMAAKDRMKGKDKLLSKKEGEKHAANMARKIKMSPSYAGAMGEELIKSGVFTEQEITKFLWVEFDEGYQRNPEKDPEFNKDPDRKRSRAERMADPKTGINSPAFKKFMASQGM